MKTSLRVVFAGTPEFAALHLQALINSDHQVVAVYSQPDRPAGRGKNIQASAVKQLAVSHNLAVYQPQSLKTPEAQQQLAALDADIMVVVAYGLILPLAILDTPKYGCLNVHGSLLPKWRGAAPIQRAIWAGDSETGVTVMQMDQGLDTGPMLLKQAMAIEAQDTSATLYDKLARVGPQALLTTLSDLTGLQAQIQDEQSASYAKKLSKQEAQIDWGLSAQQLERNVRSFNPWPVAFFRLQDMNIKVHCAQVVSTPADASETQPGQIIKADKDGILVATSQDYLLLETLQLPGKKPLKVADILNGRAQWFGIGQLLSSSITE